MTESTHTHRLELRLRKPRIGWWPKPTVAVNGGGHPSQWGVGTWQVPSDKPTLVTIYLFNRAWKFGKAEIVLPPGTSATLEYVPPRWPIGAGRLRRVIP